MWRLAVLAVLLTLPSLSWAKDKPCSANPKVNGKPFVVHGRLSEYNGAPTVRLWRIGTNRILGVSEGRFYVKGYRNLPKSIEDKLSWDVNLYGDFLVYPFTHSKPGVMQLICIESVTDLVIKKRKK